MPIKRLFFALFGVFVLAAVMPLSVAHAAYTCTQCYTQCNANYVYCTTPSFDRGGGNICGTGSDACPACVGCPSGYSRSGTSSTQTACTPDCTQCSTQSPYTLGGCLTNTNSCYRNCATSDIANSYALTGTITKGGTNTCTLTSCNGGYRKSSNACQGCPAGSSSSNGNTNDYCSCNTDTKRGGSWTGESTTSGTTGCSKPSATITFDKGAADSGAPSYTSGIFEYNTAKALPTVNTMAKAGYAFNGWGTANGCTSGDTGNKIYTSTPPSTLFACWTANSNTLSLNKNGGNCTIEGTASTTTASKSLTTGQTYTLPTIDSCAQTNYALPTTRQWCTTDGSGTPTCYNQGATYTMGSGNATLYIKWNYTVAYDGNGRTGGTAMPGSTTCVKNANCTIATVPAAPTRAGYTPNTTTWYSTNAGGTPSYASALTTYTAGPKTLYLKWTANTFYIQYDANGGSGAPGNLTCTYDGTCTLTTTAPTGKPSDYTTFVGWATSTANAASGTTVSTMNNATTTNGDTVKVYAVWSKSCSQTNTITNCSTYTTPTATQYYGGSCSAANRTCATCTACTKGAGVATCSAPGGTTCTYAATCDNGYNTPVVSNTSASCTGNNITINYNRDGGSGSDPASGSCVYGGKFNLATYTGIKSGFSYGGWQNASGTALGGNGVEINCSALGVYSGSTQVKAIWNIETNKVITFAANGGTCTTTTQSVVYNTATNLTDVNTLGCKRDGHVFTGWTGGPNGSYANGASITLTAGTTLTAGWTACGKGQYKPASANATATCGTCGAGSYQQNTGSTSCTACTDGYTSAAGAQASSSCSACGAIDGRNAWGTQTWNAATNVVDGLCTVATCIANRYKSGNTCPACSSVGDGTFTLSDLGTTTQNACYKSCDNITNASSMTGRNYYNQTDTCEVNQCTAGSYKSGTGTTATCPICAEGSYSAANGATACTACTAGTTILGTALADHNAAAKCAACTNTIAAGIDNWAAVAWSANSVPARCTISSCKAAYSLGGTNQSTTCAYCPTTGDGDCGCAAGNFPSGGVCSASTITCVAAGLTGATGNATWTGSAWDLTQCHKTCTPPTLASLPGCKTVSAAYENYYTGVAWPDCTYTVTANDGYTAHSGTAPYCSANDYTITLVQNGGTGGTTSIIETYGTKWTPASITLPSRGNSAFKGYYSADDCGGTAVIPATGTMPANTTYTAAASLYACWKCDAGTYWNGSTCTDCPRGSYKIGESNGYGAAAACTVCPGGQTTASTKTTTNTCAANTCVSTTLISTNANDATGNQGVSGWRTQTFAELAGGGYNSNCSIDSCKTGYARISQNTCSYCSANGGVNSTANGNPIFNSGNANTSSDCIVTTCRAQGYKISALATNNNDCQLCPINQWHIATGTSSVLAYTATGGNNTTASCAADDCAAGYYHEAYLPFLTQASNTPGVCSPAGDCSVSTCYNWNAAGSGNLGCNSSTCLINSCKDGYELKTACSTAADVSCESQYDSNPVCAPKTYTITLNKNPRGSNGTVSGTASASVNCTFDKACTIPVASGLSQNGYTNSNTWCKNADGTGGCFVGAVPAGTNISPTGGAITLYAKWTATEYSVALNAHNNPGGSYYDWHGTQTAYLQYDTGWSVLLGGQFSAQPSIVIPGKNGYVFNGYWTAETGGSQVIDAAGKFKTGFLTLTSNNTTVLHAQWTPKVYTILFDENNGDTPSSPAVLYEKYNTGWFTNAGASAAFTAWTSLPTRATYNFIGFTTEPNGGLVVFDATGAPQLTTISSQTGTTTLYAQWELAIIHCNAGFYKNTSGVCTQCTTGSYCEGGDYLLDTQERGRISCSTVGDGSYTLSAAGSDETSDCYKNTTCGILNSYQITGGTGTQNFGGNDTCTATLVSCNANYWKNVNACTLCPDSGIVSAPSVGDATTCYKICADKATPAHCADIINNLAAANSHYSNPAGTGGAYATCTYTVSPNTGYHTSGSPGANPSCVANNYSIKFNANGGSGATADKQCTYDQNCQLTSNGFYKTGYVWTGWATAAAAETSLSDGDMVLNRTAAENEIYNLFAKYGRCAIGYYYDGASCAECPIGAVCGTETCIDEADCCPTGKYFNGTSCVSCPAGDPTCTSGGGCSASFVCCPSGYWNDSGTCRQCAVGDTTCGTNGGGGDDHCPIGYYFTGTGCANCPNGQTTCSGTCTGGACVCPNGTTTAAGGMTSLNDCSVSCNTANGTVSATWLDPSFADVLSGKACQVDDCGGGAVPNGGGDQCDLCPIGTYKLDSFYPAQVCAICPPNFECTEPGTGGGGGLDSIFKCKYGWTMRGDPDAGTAWCESNCDFGTTGFGMQNANGACIYTGCISGYHLVDGSTGCEADVRQCNTADGTGYQTWKNGTWGTCGLTACGEGFTLKNGVCTPNDRECTTNGGTGMQSWDGTAWGTCRETACNYNHEMIGGSCVPCNLPNAATYSQSGNCKIATCKSGWHVSAFGECETNTVECEIPHAVIATKVWNNNAYGKCTPQKCEDYFHIEADACINDDQPCILDNGSGIASWNKISDTAGNWGPCIIQNCNPGYTGDKNLTAEKNKACGICKNRYGIFGEIVAASYAQECEITACNYQGELYNLEGGECVPICSPNGRSDETGTMVWNNTTHKCERTCNAGYSMW